MVYTRPALSLELRPSPTIPELLAEARALQEVVEPMFDWSKLRQIITEGDLHLLRRHPRIEELYMRQFRPLIRQAYGDIESYLKSQLEWHSVPAEGLPQAEFWTAQQTACVRQNDWSYGVPRDVTHWVVWTPRPLFHPSLCVDGNTRSGDPVREQSSMLPTPPGTPDRPHSPFSGPAPVTNLEPRVKTWKWVQAHGLTGATGFADAVQEEDIRDVLRPEREIETFVCTQWPEDAWETLWFANPPHLRSVTGLPHFHCLARRKTRP